MVTTKREAWQVKKLQHMGFVNYPPELPAEKFDRTSKPGRQSTVIMAGYQRGVSKKQKSENRNQKTDESKFSGAKFSFEILEYTK